jgi:type I restriction enzyme S subunit
VSGSEPHFALIGDLCDFSSGYGFRAKDWARKGWPIIRIQNLNGSREFNYFDGIPEPDWVVEPGQLLFAWAGTRGVSFGPVVWNGPRGVLNQHIYRIHPRQDIDKRWLHDALLVATARIERKAHGFKSSLVHVHKADITNQKVFAPPIKEQRRIAGTLEKWGYAISLTERLIAAKQQRRRGLMQQLLTGKRRFPGFSEPWRKKRIGDFLTESRVSGNHGATAKKLTVRVRGNGVVARKELRQGSESTRYYIRRAGQFIYGKLDFLNGGFGIVPEHLDSFESTADLPCFDISDGLISEFLLEYVLREAFYRQHATFAEGGRKGRRVHADEFLSIKIPVPDIGEQKAIVASAKMMDRELSLLRSQLTALKTQKRGLMQRLLTGKVRVPLPAPTAEEAA